MDNNRVNITLRHSILARMSLPVVMIITGLLSLFAALGYLWLKSGMESELNKFGDIAVSRLSKSLVEPIWFLDEQQIRESLESEMMDERITAILVREKNTETLLKGALRTADGKIVDTKDEFPDPDMVKKGVVVKEKEQIGTVEVYISEKHMKSRLHQLLLYTFTTVGLLAALLFLLIFLCIRKMLVRPVVRILAGLGQIAERDLATRLNIKAKTEIGAIANAMNAMCEKMEESVGESLNISYEVAQASSELAGSGESLSRNANLQAASLEGISASMAEIDTRAKGNAEKASDLNKNVDELKEVAETGMNEMENLKSAMKEIEDAGKSISKIIDVIDDIASQTNLLALNATIEAASAGKAGRGFAVVANEIKELANQSAKAVRETAELIECSTRKVEKGDEITARTAEALHRIARGAVRSAEMTVEIAARANEQTQAIAQISDALGQVDQVTQSNAADAEETAAAAEELSAQSEQLRKVLMRFKLSRDSHAAATVPTVRKTSNAIKWHRFL